MLIHPSPRVFCCGCASVYCVLRISKHKVSPCLLCSPHPYAACVFIGWPATVAASSNQQRCTAVSPSAVWICTVVKHPIQISVSLNHCVSKHLRDSDVLEKRSQKLQIHPSKPQSGLKQEMGRNGPHPRQMDVQVWTEDRST